MQQLFKHPDSPSRPLIHSKPFQQNLQQLLQALAEIQPKKLKFAQETLDSQIKLLFSFISPHPTISAHHIRSVIIDSPIVTRMLIQNKKQMTVRDFEEYLGTKNHHKISPITIQMRHQLELIDYLNQQRQIFSQISKLFSVTIIMDVEKLFLDIDEENQGYINSYKIAKYLEKYKLSHWKCSSDWNSPQSATSLAHHQKQNSDLPKFGNQTECLRLRLISWVIRYLKNSVAADKIFYRDFVRIVEQNQGEKQFSQKFAQKQGNIESPKLGSKLFEEEHRHHFVGKITRVTHIPYTIQNSKSPKKSQNYENSGFSAQNEENEDQLLLSLDQKDQRMNTLRTGRVNTHQSNLQLRDQEQKTENIQKATSYSDRIKETNKILSKIQFQRTKQPSFQTKLGLNHPRNKRILEKLAKTDTIEFGSSFKKHLALQYEEKIIPAFVKKSQIIYQMRYLSEIFTQQTILIKNLIASNVKFTFPNAFNAIDWKQNSMISYTDLLDFVNEADIVIYEQKLKNFYCFLDPKHEGVQYCTFVKKVFKLNSVSSIYAQCRKRRPLFAEKWSQQQKQSYCDFLREIIILFNERSSAVEILLKMFDLPENRCLQQFQRSLSEIFNDQSVHERKLTEALGKNSQNFVSEIYVEGDPILNTKSFYEYLCSLIMKNN